MKKKWSKMEISCQFPGCKSAGICLHDISTLRLWIVLLFLIALLYEGGFFFSKWVTYKGRNKKLILLFTLEDLLETPLIYSPP